MCAGKRDKCVNVASTLISENKSVAIGRSLFLGHFSHREDSSSTPDNTNADHDTRAIWVQLAQKLGVPIRCVLFKIPAKVCEHNNAVRALAGHGFNPEERSILPYSAFSSFAYRFKQPSKAEGFQDITLMEFQVSGFSRSI